MLSDAEALVIIEELSLLKFFPSAPGARMALMSLLQRMCADAGSAQWMAERAIDIFTEWPGPAELRALYTSRYKPVDGLEGHSINTQIYPELGEQEPKLLASSEAAAIEGKPILQIEGPKETQHSADYAALVKYEPELARGIAECAEMKRMPKVTDIDYDTWDDPVAIKLRQMGL